MVKPAIHKLTPQKAKAIIVKALREIPNLSRACDKAHVSRWTAYGWKENDDAFSKEWEDALERSCDSLEQEATRRARDGVVKRKFTPVVDNTYDEYEEREYSDTLLIFLLKAHRPKKFRDNTINVSSESQQAKSITIAFEDM